MLGPGPHWDQIPEFQKCPSTCQDSVSDPMLFCWTILFVYCFRITTFLFPLWKMMRVLTGFPTGRKADVVVLTCWKINYRFLKPTTHSRMLSGPVSISYGDTLCLVSSFVVGPPRCVSNHQSWRCTVCPSSTIMDKEDVTSRIKHSATEIGSWCTGCFSSQYKMSVLAWVMNEGIKAGSI